MNDNRWREYEPPPKARRDPESANAVADRMLAEHQLITDAAGLVWRYNGRHWETCGDAYLNKLAFDADGRDLSNRHRRNEIISAIKAMSMQPRLQWGRLPEHEIAFANGVLDLRSGTMRDNAPEDYLERVIPWDFVPGAHSALFEQCLADWLGVPGENGKYYLPPERLELADALQEYFGYCQMPHAKYKKALMAIGESDTGKGTVPLLLMQVVGRAATCKLSVEHMDNPKLCAVIVGKGLNIITELPASAMIRDGGFKTLVSTEDPIMIDEKNVPAYMYQPTAKHVIATNVLPEVSDRSEGVFNRLLIIPFDNIIPKDKQRRDLLDELTSPDNMAGIIAWAARGARRLYERRGVWPEPEISASLIRRYREDQNAAIRFLQECFTRNGAVAEPMTVLLGEFNKWQGGKRTSTRPFYAMMRKAAPIVAGDGSRAGEHVRKVRCVLKSPKDGSVLINPATGRTRKGNAVWALAGWEFQGQVSRSTLVINADDVPEEPDELVAENRIAGKLSETKE